MRAALVCAAALLAASAAAAESSADFFQGLIDQYKPIEGAEFTIVVPHPELRVNADGFALTPAMGVRSSFAFTPAKAGTSVSGQLCLLESEAGEMERAALEAGFKIVAVDEHFIGETPKLVFVHLERRGERDAATDAARKLLDLLRQRRVAAGLQPGPTRAAGSLDRGKIEAAFSVPAKEDEGVLRLSYPFAEVSVRGTMDKAAVAGVLSKEPDASALAALVKAGARLAAVSRRETAFWGVGRPAELGPAVAAAAGSLREKEEAPGP